MLKSDHYCGYRLGREQESGKTLWRSHCRICLPRSRPHKLYCEIIPSTADSRGLAHHPSSTIVWPKYLSSDCMVPEVPGCQYQASPQLFCGVASLWQRDDECAYRIHAPNRCHTSSRGNHIFPGQSGIVHMSMSTVPGQILKRFRG